jgi:hypothetical protein
MEQVQNKKVLLCRHAESASNIVMHRLLDERKGGIQDVLWAPKFFKDFLTSQEL